MLLSPPRRVTVGLEHNRLAMLLAVLHRHGGVSTAGCDVFANIVGGVRVTETGGEPLSRFPVGPERNVVCG